MAGWLGKVEEKIWHQGIGDLGFPDSEKLIAPQTEMEKRGCCERVRAIFFVGCANLLAVYAQTS